MAVRGRYAVAIRDVASASPWLAIAILCAAGGCRSTCDLPRHTIDELFQEAVEHSTRHAEASYGAHPEPVETVRTVGHAEEIGPGRRPGDDPPPVPPLNLEVQPRVTMLGGPLGDVGESEADAAPPTARISQDFQETDLREALQALATEARVSLVIDDKARGVVNASIDDQTFEEALEKVLLPLGYVYVRKGRHYLVASLDPESTLFPHVAERFEFRPLHHATSELTPMLPTRLQKYVRVLDKRSQLVIEAPRQLGLQIVRRLEELDQPVSQVVLEAIVCVISPNKGFRFNFNIGQSLADGANKALDVGVSGLAVASTVTPYGTRHVFDDFSTTSAFVNLLAQDGYLTIRAAPRVMAKDGEKAEISIARETYFSTQPAATGANQANSFIFQPNLQKVDAGIVLNITPHIRGDNVTVEIQKAEVSEDIRTSDAANAPSANPYPIISRRQVSTTVHVKDGKTIVIGGLVQRQTVDRVSRIPGLGDVPLLGRLFQTVEKQEQDAEVVIFISPRIITSGQPCRVANVPDSRP